METAVPKNHPVELIRNQYIQRRKANPSYSLTAFARDLGVSVSFLSRLLSGQRSMTVNQAVQVATILGLNSKEIDQTVEALILSAEPSSKISKKFVSAVKTKHRKDNLRLSQTTHYEVENFRAISEWYHLAILNLTQLHDFDPSPKEIAKRLGITRTEAADAVQRLQLLGLIQKINGRVTRTQQSLYIKTTQSKRAVREFIKQTLKKSEAILDDSSAESFERRCMPGTTLPIDSRNLSALKELLLKFQLEFAESAQAQRYDEVYQLNLHFFPLTLNQNPHPNQKKEMPV